MLHVIPTTPKNKFTTNILCLLIRRPLCREEVTSTALLPPLLARGCKKYPTVQDIRLAAESLQGSIFDAQIIKKGEEQILQFFFECVDDCDDSGLTFKGEVLDFLHEIILNPLLEGEIPAFHSANVKGEKENLKNRIEGRINNKSEYAKLKCIETMCAGEPFGLYGDGYAEDLPNITTSNLLKHYHNILANSTVEFIALGNWDEGWLKREIDSRFSALFISNKIIPKPILNQARTTRQLVTMNHNTSQGNLVIGLRGEVKPLGMDYIHLQLAKEILGGSPNAKLFANIREKESLCYSVYSSLYRFKSLMCIVAGSEPDKLDYVLELAEKEINALKKGEFSKDDLYNAKQSLQKRWRSMEDYPSACVDFYATQYLLEDPRKLEDMLDQVEKAGADGVAQSFSRLNIDTVVMMR